jgi:hypothetical protein
MILNHCNTTAQSIRIRHPRFHLLMRGVAFKGFLLGTLLSITTMAVRADDWAAPQTREVFSASREYFVRVTPGESLGDTFGFAGQKKGKYAAAEFYRRHQDRSYRLVTEVVLLNPVAPVEFFVSDDGRLATIDNWHNVGYGKVVSIYDSRGKVVQSYDLSDLFQDEEIKTFGRSVSSIHWRNGPAYIRQDQKTLLITVKSGGDFLFVMETGRFKYCEYQEKTYRCRDTNQPREWMPNSRVPLTR